MNNSATTRVITKIAIEYNANDKGTAKLMADNNLINDQPELQYQEMKNIANRNPNVKKWAFTGYISPPKEIGDHLSDEALTEIALQALKKVGVSHQNQYRLDIHHSTKQKHIHFLVNRINTQGKCTVKSHDIGKRFGDAVREVCIAKGLRTDVDIGIEKRTEMLKQLLESIKQAHHFEELLKRMNAKGYEVVLSQNEKDGISGMRITKWEDKNTQTERVYKSGYKLSELTRKLKIAEIKQIFEIKIAVEEAKQKAVKLDEFRRNLEAKGFRLHYFNKEFSISKLMTFGAKVDKNAYSYQQNKGFLLSEIDADFNGNFDFQNNRLPENRNHQKNMIDAGFEVLEELLKPSYATPTEDEYYKKRKKR